MNRCKVRAVKRTPENAFDAIEDFPYMPNYFTTHLFCEDGVSIRMAYIDEGPRDAEETLLLTHGEPSWSYLYRKMIPVFLAKGYRIIAPDLVGFGRSDKPANDTDYNYERHYKWMTDLCINHLDLKNVTAIFQVKLPLSKMCWYLMRVCTNRTFRTGAACSDFVWSLTTPTALLVSGRSCIYIALIQMIAGLLTQLYACYI